MLGCQDFCGYYEWTFHYLRRRFGRVGLEKYWAQAIAGDSQRHYLKSAKAEGLRGLYESWLKTGIDEECDWTVTLDENQNLLRLDMRQCPSKGFLLDNDLNADEDYCDHCMGWIGPALHQVGAEVAAHEHNHCGQCWWEIRNASQSEPPVEISSDIRRDARWGQGYLDRFAHHEKLPLLTDGAHADSCDVLAEWFRSAQTIVVLGPHALEGEALPAIESTTALILSGRQYVTMNCAEVPIRGVLIEHDREILPEVSARFHSAVDRPLLMHCYLPRQPFLNFAAHGLPRAVPILPLLIRSGVYVHRTNRPIPAPWIFAVMLAAALKKPILPWGSGLADAALDVDLRARFRATS
ncbi:MAG TPA: hypothetical protein VHE81_19035 [Lacipirellulaceae bacterium]|nr:hypothetical protein [Lacipirellulaceae bacterium]